MANLEKKEIIEKVTDKVEDKDLQMELLEDIADSFKEPDREVVDKKDYDAVVLERDTLQNKYNDLQNKYITRFSSIDPKDINKVAEPVGLQESKVIDIRSIF